MKGYRIWILVTAIIAFVLGVVMVVLDLYYSWSEHEGHPEEPLLTATLLSIILCFVIRSFYFHDRDQKLLWGIRVKHWDLAIMLAFCGVLIFSINHVLPAINNIHLVATGTGILLAQLQPILYFYRVRDENGRRNMPAFWGSVAGMITSCFLFSGGYIFHLYSTGTGEVLAEWPIIVYVLGTNKTT